MALKKLLALLLLGFAAAEEDVAGALALDGECESGEACALNALQLRGAEDDEEDEDITAQSERDDEDAVVRQGEEEERGGGSHALRGRSREVKESLSSNSSGRSLATSMCSPVERGYRDFGNKNKLYECSDLSDESRCVVFVNFEKAFGKRQSCDYLCNKFHMSCAGQWRSENDEYCSLGEQDDSCENKHSYSYCSCEPRSEGPDTQHGKGGRGPGGPGVYHPPVNSCDGCRDQVTQVNSCTVVQRYKCRHSVCVYDRTDKHGQCDGRSITCPDGSKVWCESGRTSECTDQYCPTTTPFPVPTPPGPIPSPTPSPTPEPCAGCEEVIRCSDGSTASCKGGTRGCYENSPMYCSKEPTPSPTPEPDPEPTEAPEPKPTEAPRPEPTEAPEQPLPIPDVSPPPAEPSVPAPTSPVMPPPAEPSVPAATSPVMPPPAEPSVPAATSPLVSPVALPSLATLEDDDAVKI